MIIFKAGVSYQKTAEIKISWICVQKSRTCLSNQFTRRGTVALDANICELITSPFVFHFMSRG